MTVSYNWAARGRSSLRSSLRRLSAQLLQLPLQQIDSRGQRSKVRSNWSFLVRLLPLLLLLVRGHGNYFTAIQRNIGTDLHQLITFALRNKVDAGAGPGC